MNIIDYLSKKPFSVIGHRGAKGVRPENTISAIKYAIDVGVDIVEVDVRKTKDNKLILLHDKDFKRLTGMTLTPRDLDFDFIKENITIDGESVALLEEAIFVVKGKIGLFIEIKEPDTVKDVMDIVDKSDCMNQIAVISFYEEVLREAKKINPDITTGLVYMKPPGKILEAKEVGAKIVLPSYGLATEKAVRFAHRLKLKVVSWVINSEQQLKTAVSRGVDGIATDYPGMIVKLRENF
ncbi:glycerophosphodiester phosphodiesterase [Persephonella sp.]